MGFCTLAFQRDRQFHARQFGAEIGEMRAIDRAPRATVMETSSTCTAPEIRREADMIQLGVRAQHDLETDIARFRRGGMLGQGKRQRLLPAPAALAHAPGPSKFRISGSSMISPLGTRSATPPRAMASDTALTALDAQHAVMRLHPIGPVRFLQLKNLHASRQQRQPPFVRFPRRTLRRPSARARSEYFHSSTRRVGSATAIVMPRPSRSAHSPWLPAPAPIPCRLRRQCGHWPAHGCGRARCNPAGADNA